MSTTGTEAGTTAERVVPATVLIVEDEDATRNLCRDVAADSGLRTRSASQLNKPSIFSINSLSILSLQICVFRKSAESNC